MRSKILIKILMDENRPIKRDYIAEKMNLSESSIRNIVKDTNYFGLKHGFQIKVIKGKGYFLNILDENKFNNFLGKKQELEPDIYNSSQRVYIILFYILQSTKPVTINDLMERMNLSRTTIVKELEKVDEKLRKSNLKLERKKHYGISVTGSEKDYRKAFSKYVLTSNLYLEPAKNFKEFLENTNVEDLKNVLHEAIYKYNLRISDVAFKNVVDHLKILIFRVSQGNFIASSVNISKIDEIYLQISEYICSSIKDKYNITVPGTEVKFLAVHISAKTFTSRIDTAEKDLLAKDIKNILEYLDNEFLTDFRNSEELKESLLLHMFPLLNRLYYNLQLENPLIEEIYAKYANVFVVSYRFAELIEKKYSYMLSRDEIGYIAIHFAVYLERLKNKSLENIKRIIVICETGGGSAQLLKLKLESIFKNAIVITISAKEIKNFDDQLPDLFLSTIPIGKEYKGISIIHVKSFLDENEIARLKESVALKFWGKMQINSSSRVSSLFHKNLFNRVERGNYIEIIKEMSDKLIKEDIAIEGFTESVLQRESKFTTIYKNGIAGPHPMMLNSKKNAVGVTILEEAISYNGKSVQIIFLISLKQGNLFLHKEISRLLLFLIDNVWAKEKLLNSLSFEQFIYEINNFI